MSEKEIKNEEVKKEAVQENLEEIASQNPLVYHLHKPIDHFQNHIEFLDMRGLENLTLKDMEEIQAQYNYFAGSAALMQEINPIYMKLVLSKVTGYPVEVMEQISASDTARLKNRIYRFFYLAV